VRSALQQIGPRVIHSNGIKMHVMSAIANTGAAPVIWHLRDYLGRRSLSARLLRQLCSSCAVAVAVSHDVAADADRVFKGRCPKVVAQYDGVDVQSFSPQGDAADLDLLARLPAPPPGSVRIGLVATYGRWKGHEVFLRALARLDRDKRWRGYVVGGALYQTRDSQYSVEELKGLARGLDLPADRLGFTGHVADSARALRALDVVVHASTQPEPFGRVIVEGMACAKAVIYSNAGGAAELAKDGETALGTRPGDDAHLAGHLGRLIDDPALRARLGAAGRVWARDRFDAGQHVPAFIELYGNVLEQHGARPALA
jgi:glycosyltransferase involved in cell wall biosynthesis